MAVDFRQITHSYGRSWRGVEYGSRNPFRFDRKRILLISGDDGRFGLYDGSGTFLMTLPISASGEPAWLPDGSILFISGNQLKRWTEVVSGGTSSGAIEVFHTFSE